MASMNNALCCKDLDGHDSMGVVKQRVMHDLGLGVAAHRARFHLLLALLACRDSQSPQRWGQATPDRAHITRSRVKDLDARNARLHAELHASQSAAQQQAEAMQRTQADLENIKEVSCATALCYKACTTVRLFGNCLASLPQHWTFPADEMVAWSLPLTTSPDLCNTCMIWWACSCVQLDLNTDKPPQFQQVKSLNEKRDAIWPVIRCGHMAASQHPSSQGLD